MRSWPILLPGTSRRCCASPGGSLEFVRAATQPSRMIDRLHYFALAAVLLALLPASAHAQSADLVLCDRLAADPADPDKPADVKGVGEVAAGDIATAIRFCKVAAVSARRAMYELGRAYLANRQPAEAQAAFRKAADKGSSS